MASPTLWTWVWVSSRRWWRTGKPAWHSPWGHKVSDITEWLNWTNAPYRASQVGLVLNISQSFPILCNPMDCSLPGSSVHGIQEYWNELPFPSLGGGSSPPRDWTWVHLIASQFFTFWATREAECGTSGREPVCHAGDIRSVGFISGSRKSPGGGHRNPLQYSCLENPTDRGAWWATVQGVANRWTWLKQFNTYKGMLLPGEFLLPSKDKQWLAIYVGLSTVEGIGLH